MNTRKHYLEMDGLRGVAALSVALFHMQNFFGGPGFFGHGYLAVDFFFMLSGFVLTHAYGARLTHRGSLKYFLRDRIIRLYPMLLVGATTGLAVALLSQEQNSRSLASIIAAAAINAAGLPAVWDAKPFWINEPTWSLFFEIVANLLFGILAYLITNRRLFIVAGLAVVLMLVLNYRVGLFGFGWTRKTLGGGFVRVSASFAIGMILQRLHSTGVLANGGKRWWVAPTLVASFIFFPTYSKPSVFYDPFVVFVLYPFLILASAGSEEIFPSIAKLSGALSYPFYVIHVPVLHLIQQSLVVGGLALSGGVVLGSIGATLIISWLIWRFYDEPVRAFLRRRYGSAQHRKTKL